MAKKIKKFLTLVLVFGLVANLAVVSSMAANCHTILHNSNNSSKLPFDKMNITLFIGETVDENDEGYSFAKKGSGSWERNSRIDELTIDEGGSLSVVIKCVINGDYYAELTNHGNGNDNKASNGTLNYDINNVRAVENGDSAEDDSAEDDSAEDDSAEDDSAEDDSAEDDSAEDDSAEDDSAEDDSAEDDSAEDDSAEDDSAEDDSAEDDSAEDDSAEDDSAEDDSVVKAYPEAPVYVPEVAVIDEESIPEEEIPAAELPVEEIFEEEVPMAEVPETGDMTSLWAAASVISAAGVLFLGKKNKDEK